jgi:MFS transporter, ACS family, hexuronate transporter
MATSVSAERMRRKIPRLRWVVLCTNAGVLVLNYGDRAALGVATPLIIGEFGFSKSSMGIILGAFAFTYAPACLLGGWAADRFGPRKTMTVAALWWSIFTAATAGCVNIATFLLQRLAFGLGEGPQGATTARTMGNWFPKREYATAVGFTFAFNPLGAAVGIPVVTWLLVVFHHNWRAPFLALGAIGVVVAALWWLVVRDHPAQHPRITETELAHITDDQYDNGAADVDTTAVPPLRWYVTKPAVWANALAFFGFSWILFMFLSWYPQFLVEVHHVDLKNLAWAGALPWVAGAVGTALGGVISDYLMRRTGRDFTTRKWMAVICLAGSAGLVVPIAAIDSTGAAVTLLAGALLLLYLANVQFFALVAASVHPLRLGGVTGFVHFCANCAAIVAPIATGYIIGDLHSWSLAFGLAAALALIGAVALALSRPPRPTAGRGQHRIDPTRADQSTPGKEFSCTQPNM